jgi:hypothetical protein
MDESPWVQTSIYVDRFPHSIAEAWDPSNTNIEKVNIEKYRL